MPRRYEEEINEILNKFDGDWPPPNEKRRARPEPRHASPQLTPHIGAEQIMVLGLALILAGVLLRFSFRLGVTAPAGIGAYATAIGVLLLMAGYVMAILRGGIGGGSLGRGQRFWRGEVVDLRPSSRGLAYWWWRVRSNLRRR